MSEQPASCRNCGTPLPEEATFCPSCGTRVAAGDTVREELPRHEPTPAPPSVAQSEPRVFGLPPATFLAVLALVAVVGAVFLLVRGNWVGGLVVLGVGLLLAAGFLEAGRRKPDTAAARASAGALDAFGARAGVAARSLLTQSAARREILRRRSEAMGLRAERERLLRDLGDAAYRGEDLAPLRDRIRALDERLQGLDAEAASIAEEARRRVSQERLGVQPTEVRRPDDRD